MWLHIPSLFALESVGLTLESGSPVLADLSRHCTRRGKLIAPRSWLNAWRKDSSIKLLCGVTSKQSALQKCALTFAREQEVKESVSSRRESLAKATASPESATSKTTHETFGQTQGESYAKWEPSCSFWRTCLVYLFQSESGDFQRQSQGYSESWPKMGSMRNGCLYPRQPVELRTEGNECSCWPTANAHDGRRPGHDDDSTQGMNLKREAENWPTPDANSHKGSNQEGQRRGQLDEATEVLWRSPAVQEPGITTERLEGGGIGHRNYDKETGRLAQLGLTQQTEMWQSPGNMGGGSVSRGGERIGEPLLAGQAKFWTTPTKNANLDCPAEQARNSPAAAAAAGMLMESLTGPRVHPTLPPGSESLPKDPTSRRRRLNPKFVNWLMGLPENWSDVDTPIERTSFERWATLSSRFVERLRSLCYGNECSAGV